MTWRTAADAITIVVGVAVLAALGVHYLSPRSMAPVSLGVGTQLKPSVGIDTAAASRTLILSLQSDCQYCRDSMPFYRRLMARNETDLQVVVAAPPHDTGIGEYLASEAVHPDAVVFVERGQLPLLATPTLFVVDASGTVTHAWLGRLDADREADVLSVLFG